MRRVLLTSVALLASLATAAVAADLPRRMPTKAPAYVPAGYNWTGFYVGINGGYGWGRSYWNSFGSRDRVSGGMVGGTVGYNWQALGSPWVFGLEGDIDWTDIKGTFANAACPTGCQTKNDWLGTARGRVGYAWDRTMPLRAPAAPRSATSRRRRLASAPPAIPMSAGPPAAASRRRWSAT